MESNKPFEQALRDGDAHAYEELFERYAKGLMRLSYSILADTVETEDVVQEVLIQFIDSVQSGRFQGGNGTMLAYLRKSIRNKCIDRIRKRKNNRISLDEDEYLQDMEYLESPLQPSQWLDEKRLLEQIESVIFQMRPMQRAAIVMRIVENLSYREIANELHSKTHRKTVGSVPR